jgi:hypothetical protein
MISESLIHVEECLKKIKAPVLKYLKAGISKKTIQESLARIFPDLRLHHELYELYRWHNGTNTDSSTYNELFYLFPTFYLNSFEEIFMLYKHNYFNLIENKMIPLFSTGNGELLAINIDKSYGDISKTPIFYLQNWDHSSEIYTTIYDDVYSMFETAIECYNKKSFYIDNDGLLVMDFEKSWEISKEMNPNSDYWKAE